MDGIERFLVSTGRSGSTLPSKKFTENQNLLSLSEFLGAMGFYWRFTAEPLSGDAFTLLLCGGTDVGVMMPPGQVINDIFTEFRRTEDDLAVGVSPALPPSSRWHSRASRRIRSR